jgi:phosphoglycolate phosphatase
MGHEAVVFDFDGTLVDSLQDIAAATNRVLAQRGFPPHPLDAYRYFVGDGMEMLVRRALPPEYGDDETVAALLPDVRQDYAAHSLERTALYPGIADLLDALATRDVPIAILTNKPHKHTLPMVERLLPRWRFAAVLGAAPGLPRKPDPTGALRVARATGVVPAHWRYLGDTGTDMRTARAAGMTAVGVLWGFRAAEELRAAGAHHLIERPMDLLPLLRDDA